MTSLLRDPMTPAAPVSWRPQEKPDASPIIDPEIEALRRENEDLVKALAEAEANAITEAEGAYARGKADAEATFERDEAKRLKALEAALTELVKQGRSQFKHIERLALLLCETSLEQVFGAERDLKDLSARALARQMRGLRRETILAVRVSESDFCDGRELAALEQRLGIGGSHIRLESDANLKSGDSVIQLRLGHVELSLPEHWSDVRQALLTMAEAPDAP